MSSSLLDPAVLRHGPGHWLHSWALLLRWHVVSLRLALPSIAVVQCLIGVGAVVAVRIWLDTPVPGAEVFVTTGAATLTLTMVGLVALPQMVAEHRLRGTYDYQWSLPIPRSSATVASLTVSLVIAAPALVATLIAGVVVYDLDLAVSPSIVSAVLLTAGTAGAIGSALAHGVGNPRLVSMASQTLIFVIFGFSPVLYPSTNLPRWLATVHEWLPFDSMATVVRAGLTAGLVDELTRAYAVLIAWFAMGLIVTAIAVGRRG